MTKKNATPRRAAGMTVQQAAPAEGSVYALALCIHCSRDIVLMTGDTVWLHDNTGLQRCDGLPGSTPGERSVHLFIV